MNLFEQLTREALRNTTGLGSLRPVVEKELLHHDILRELSSFGSLSSLVFMGGTCLRACYGSIRLSEDLDFYGGINFHRDQLAAFPQHLESVLMEKYGLKVEVRIPKAQEQGSVETWKVSILTRPDRPDLPAQRIHLDICALPSMNPTPRVLRNPYGVEMGTSGLILQAASREEILADKFVALALRRGRVKFRDLWDIHWLTQSTVSLRPQWVLEKASLRGYTQADFLIRLRNRLQSLQEKSEYREEFLAELKRFLPVVAWQSSLESPDFWRYLIQLLWEQSAPVFSRSEP
ncbi:MAG: nucleotidyl transferase AbiEii/AbiGii toxin family protein [Kiritimatiellia bacterium]